MDEKIIHKEIQIEDGREYCKDLCNRETILTKKLENKEDEFEKQQRLSILEDEELQNEKTILEEKLRRIEFLEARMRTAVLDGEKVTMLPTDDDTPLFELYHHQHFKPRFVLRHHNGLVDVFNESDQYVRLREEIQEKHNPLAARIEKKNAALTALQGYYDSKFKRKFFFVQRKKEMKKKLKDSLLGLRQDVAILEAMLQTSKTKCSNNKTFDIDLEF